MRALFDMNFIDIRDKLLISNNLTEYNEIVSFMRNPLSGLPPKAKQRLLDFGNSSFETEIITWFKTAPSDYDEKIRLGQIIIWQEILLAYEALSESYKLLKDIQVVVYKNDYLKSVNQVRSTLDIYAKSKAAITTLESHLGVDRYLDFIAESEFGILREKFDDIHRILDTKLTEYKKLFALNWGNTNVCDVMIHKLVRPNMDNQICSLFQHSKKRVWLFIIDGCGMGQYLWSKSVVPINVNLAYSNNIFKWLSDNNLLDEYILGAPLVTDTAAGMSQIFIGKNSKTTRIFSSTVNDDTHKKDFIPIKSLPTQSFAKIANTECQSFTVDISSENYDMKIYYCSKYDERNVSGFSKYIFDGAEVKQVALPERVFSFLREDTQKDSSGASVIYITSVDHYGHTMGSFSQFERYEYEKLNQLFKNFLIDTAKNHPDFFDGSTSIVITADHGMTESYKINISRDTISRFLAQYHEYPSIVDANRAEFIYGISKSKIGPCAQGLRTFFSSKKVNALVLTKNDELFSAFIPEYEQGYSNTSPDIIVLLISEGLFYNKNTSEHLMHFGGHGGHSVDEVFVPLINLELNKELYNKINNRFLNLN